MDRSKEVLVTGGAGFIRSHVACELRRWGYVVYHFGAAPFLEALIEKPVEKLVVASSVSIYDEGLYRDSGGSLVSGTERGLDQLQRGGWEVQDEAGETLRHPSRRPSPKRLRWPPFMRCPSTTRRGS